MAEGYLKHYAGSKAEVCSAGIEAHGVNPVAVTVMKEDGLDISGQTSNKIDEYNHLTFDYVITVCDNARENCPYFPAQVKKLHHNFPDPAKATGTEEEIIAQFRLVRDMIKSYIKEFVSAYL
jgi:arsenate reductase